MSVAGGLSRSACNRTCSIFGNKRGDLGLRRKFRAEHCWSLAIFAPTIVLDLHKYLNCQNVFLPEDKSLLFGSLALLVAGNKECLFKIYLEVLRIGSKGCCA